MSGHICDPRGFRDYLEVSHDRVPFDGEIFRSNAHLALLMELLILSLTLTLIHNPIPNSDPSPIP